jgi:hypothetical protein
MSQTAGEVLDSMTGHEESWVADQFGKSIGELVSNFLERSDVGPYYRALIFVLKRREGVNEDDARNAVLDMRIKDVVAFFKREAEGSDADESEVLAESGKDEPQPEPLPENSLSSVS